MSDLTSKSVRLPDYLIEYIESQEGKTFSEKLILLLDDLHHGEVERQKKLQSYQSRIGYYDKIYVRLLNDYGEARRIIISMHKYLDDLRRLAAKASIPEPEVPEPEDPDFFPGNMPFT